MISHQTKANGTSVVAPSTASSERQLWWDQMLEYRQREFMRVGGDLQAYELLQHMGQYKTLSEKLDLLVRHHRRHVFDDRSGDAHHRALTRLLSKTITAKAAAFSRHADRQERIGRHLTAMGY